MMDVEHSNADTDPKPSRAAPRLPPQDVDAERSVLGAMFLQESAVSEVFGLLGADDFYKKGHRIIMRTMADLFERNEPIDEVTVAAALKTSGELEAAGGIAYLAGLTESVPTAANAMYYARIVRDRSLARRLIDAATDIAQLGYEGGDVALALDQAEAKIFEITHGREERDFVPLKQAIKTAFQQIEQAYERKATVTGVATGYIDMDQKTAGLQPSDLIIIAGRPSMGKTALALNIGQNTAIRDKTPVAVFSLEMSKEQLVLRMLCSEARIEAQKIRSGFLKDTDWPKLATAASVLSQAPVYLDDTGAISLLEMRAKARRLKAEKGLGLIVVDYLQLMRGRQTENREREISEISRGLKSLAKELNVPVVALSQLNRSLESRQDKRPMLSDLRESGAIEQDADVICFVYRDEYYNEKSNDKGIAEIIIGKQRNGPTGMIKLRFFNEFTRFDNYTEGSA